MGISNNYINEIKKILKNARQKAYTAVNSAMVEAYWEIGRRIVEEEQNGKERAEYGKEILQNLSKELTEEFGKGYSYRTLREIRQFYLMFSDFEKWRTVSAKLTWSHFQKVLRVSDEKARIFYLTEAAENMWSVRTLDRNISTLYYDRIVASIDKKTVEDEMKDKTKKLQAEDFIKNPVVLEFLDLPTNMSYTENELEKALTDDIQKFMMELGKGFAFVERQQHIRTENSDFYIDLVFYNYILKCFVIVELKTEKLTHQDIGQLDMYIRMYDDLKKQENDNPTIGLLLCTETDRTIIKYSVLKKNKSIFLYPSFLDLFKGLKIFRLGIRVFEEGRNGWEYSHGLSHALNLEELLPLVEKEKPEMKYTLLYAVKLKRKDKRVKEYLYGNEIPVDKAELLPLISKNKEEKSGLGILYCDGIALGFGYFRNGRLRNFYPKGLRFRN